MPTGRVSVEGRAFLSADRHVHNRTSEAAPRRGVLVGAKHRPLRRGIAFLTAAVFGLLPPLQVAGAAELAGARSRQQLAAAERAIPRQPRGLAAPHSQDLKEGMAYRVAHDRAVLDITAGALSADTTLSITPLAAGAMAPVDQGLINTTPGPRAGYRMGPPGQRFASPITITLPYDRKLLPENMPERNLRIFWYDFEKKQWTPLKRVEVNAYDQTVT